MAADTGADGTVAAIIGRMGESSFKTAISGITDAAQKKSMISHPIVAAAYGITFSDIEYTSLAASGGAALFDRTISEYMNDLHAATNLSFVSDATKEIATKVLSERSTAMIDRLIANSHESSIFFENLKSLRNDFGNLYRPLSQGITISPTATPAEKSILFVQIDALQMALDISVFVYQVFSHPEMSALLLKRDDAQSAQTLSADWIPARMNYPAMPSVTVDEIMRRTDRIAFVSRRMLVSIESVAASVAASVATSAPASTVRAALENDIANTRDAATAASNALERAREMAIDFIGAQSQLSLFYTKTILQGTQGSLGWVHQSMTDINANAKMSTTISYGLVAMFIIMIAISIPIYIRNKESLKMGGSSSTSLAVIVGAPAIMAAGILAMSMMGKM